MRDPLTAVQLEELRRIDTCTVSNVIESFGVRVRNEGFADSSVRSIFTHFPPAVGYAVTARIRTAPTPTFRHNYYDRTDWWNHILTVPEPCLIVVQDLDETPGLGSFLGEVHANIRRALGCVGAITNGAVRDLPAVEEIGFHLFARHVAVSHAYAHIVDFGFPTEVGGLTVRPGTSSMEIATGFCRFPSRSRLRFRELQAGFWKRRRELCRSANRQGSLWRSCVPC